MAKVVSPGVAALRKVVEDVYAAAREAKTILTTMRSAAYTSVPEKRNCV